MWMFMFNVYDTDNALSEQHTIAIVERKKEEEEEVGISECTSKRNRKKNGKPESEGKRNETKSNVGI